MRVIRIATAESGLDQKIEESVADLREFVAEHGSLMTAESWTEAAMLHCC